MVIYLKRFSEAYVTGVLLVVAVVAPHPVRLTARDFSKPVFFFRFIILSFFGDKKKKNYARKRREGFSVLHRASPLRVPRTFPPCHSMLLQYVCVSAVLVVRSPACVRRQPVRRRVSAYCSRGSDDDIEEEVETVSNRRTCCPSTVPALPR